MKILHAVLPLIACTLLLAGCTIQISTGQGQVAETGEASISPLSTPVPPEDTPLAAVSTPLPATETPVPPTPAKPLPTDTPPGEDTPLAAAPTDTPLPPTPTDTPLPPTPTALPPTDTPAAPTAAPAPGQVADMATGLCRNPYYPVSPTARWRYETQLPQSSIREYTMTHKEITAEAFTEVQTSPDYTGETPWRCTAEGLMAREFATMALSQMRDLEFETLDYGGVQIPPAEKWQVGSRWRSTYEVKVTARVMGMSVDVLMDVTMDHELTAVEEVTVPAGTYPRAYRVETFGDIEITPSQFNAMAQDFRYSSWYVEGVGRVKQLSTDQNNAFNADLVSLE